MNKPTSAMQRLKGLKDRVEPSKVNTGREMEIPLNKIVFDKEQPRSDFHHADGQVASQHQMSLEELAESIRENGLIEPITVEPLDDGNFRVLVGERRTRAHLKLGKTTIRASVNDTLVNGDPKARLLYQLAENVNREDLSEMDMARNIQNLMKSEAGSPAMTQTQIAKSLGKSEGWVSRYVRYGDEELQRLWVATGIADTVENLYRISVLPKHVQADLQRRVLLDQTDPDFLPRPLPRSVIDALAKDAKQAKKGGTVVATAQVRSVPANASAFDSSPDDQPSVKPQTGVTEVGQQASALGSSTDPGDDEVTHQLAKLAADGQKSTAEAPAQPPAKSDNSKDYTLPEEGRADILNKVQVAVANSSIAQPPVSVRVNVAGLKKLLESLAAEEVSDLNAVPLTLTLAAPLAQRIANSLAGVIVDPAEVPSVVQNQMVKL